MRHAAASPLRALVDYYDRLSTDPSQAVAEPGFAVQKIHFQVILEPDGTLHAFEPIRLAGGRAKPLPQPLMVPDGGGRSGTGLKPFFCWDNTGYALGRDNKGKPARSTEMFAAFRDLHLSFQEELAGDEGFTALCRFLERWEPSKAEQLPNWDQAAGFNVVFRLRDREQYVHQSEPVRAAWLRRTEHQDEAPTLGESLLTGEVEEIARLHPLIKGVNGAQTTGAAIVSFNCNAFESYGKTQGFNAPVGSRDVHRYTTALNRLLADPNRRARIGDATVVFWSDRAEETDFEKTARALISDDAPRELPTEHAETLDQVRDFLDAVRNGTYSDRLKEPDAPFYILGLSPNSSRLNLRHWYVGTVRDFAKRLARHAEDLEIGGQPRSQAILSVQSIVAETVRRGEKSPPQLASNIARAVLGEFPVFPESLLLAVLQRIRADGNVTWRQASVIKAFLLRVASPQEKEFLMELYVNKSHFSKSYHSGRLLAVLGFVQKQALGDINAGVIRRHMGSVIATPGDTLGRLVLAAEIAHIPKLDGDLPTFVRDEIKEICLAIQDEFPKRLSAREQGQFALGFYQETQHLDFIGDQVRQRKRLRTIQGEWVQSRYEMYVADALHRYRLAYFYEPRAMLGEKAMWPDFLVRHGVIKPLYVEVLGMNTPEYNARWGEKLKAYQRAELCSRDNPKGELVVIDCRTPEQGDQAINQDAANAKPRLVMSREKVEQDVYEKISPFLNDPEKHLVN